MLLFDIPRILAEALFEDTSISKSLSRVSGGLPIHQLLSPSLVELTVDGSRDILSCRTESFNQIFDTFELFTHFLPQACRFSLVFVLFISLHTLCLWTRLTLQASDLILSSLSFHGASLCPDPPHMYAIG
jgi:hypothetical protein